MACREQLTRGANAQEDMATTRRPPAANAQEDMATTRRPPARAAATQLVQRLLQRGTALGTAPAGASSFRSLLGSSGADGFERWVG